MTLIFLCHPKSQQYSLSILEQCGYHSAGDSLYHSSEWHNSGTVKAMEVNENMPKTYLVPEWTCGLGNMCTSSFTISNNLISFRVLGACERLKPALMAILFGISRPVTGALAGPFKVTGEPDTCNLQHILF